MPVLPSWLTEPLWDQFAAPLPQRPEFDPVHPLGCHRRRINDRTVSGKLPQVLRFGCSCEAIADSGCSATTIRSRRDEWIRLGVFARLKQIALEAYDRVVGLILDQVAVDGAITKASGGCEAAGRSPVDRGKKEALLSLPPVRPPRLRPGCDSADGVVPAGGVKCGRSRLPMDLGLRLQVGPHHE